MSDTTSLDDIFDEELDLNDTPAPEKPAEAEAAAPEPEPVDQSDEPGEKEAEAPPAPQSEDKSQPRHVPLAALDEERARRRENEQRVRDLEAEIAAYKVRQQTPQRPPQEQPKPPSAWDDPDAAISYAVQQANAQAAQRQAAMSEEVARATFPDYDEQIKKLGEAVKANPSLQHEIWSSPAPAIAAYRAAKRYAAQEEIGDPAAFREKLKAELLAEIQAERKANPAPHLPQSMAAGASVGARRGPGWSGPTPLDDIL